MKTISILAVLVAGCTSREPHDPPPVPDARTTPTPRSLPGASQAEPFDVSLADLPPEVLDELLRLEEEQLALENEMAGVRKEPADVAWVKARLANMVAVDQLLRNSMMLPGEKGWDAATSQAFMRVVGPRATEVDQRNTFELRTLIERHGWFNVSTFGPEADRDAWLLVQHADLEPVFQAEVLAVLEELVPLGETSPSNFAYLYDRVARAQGRPQRYGTQGACVGVTWEPHPIEDPEAVDALRSSVGLGTLADYKVLCSRLCR